MNTHTAYRLPEIPDLPMGHRLLDHHVSPREAQRRAAAAGRWFCLDDNGNTYVHGCGPTTDAKGTVTGFAQTTAWGKQRTWSRDDKGFLRETTPSVMIEQARSAADAAAPDGGKFDRSAGRGVALKNVWQWVNRASQFDDWLLLWSTEPGRGKTAVATHVLVLLAEAGVQAEFHTSFAIRDALRRTYRSNDPDQADHRANWDDLKHRLKTVRALILDDMGREAEGNGINADLHDLWCEVLDARKMAKLPTLFTSNKRQEQMYADSRVCSRMGWARLLELPGKDYRTAQQNLPT